MLGKSNQRNGSARCASGPFLAADFGGARPRFLGALTCILPRGAVSRSTTVPTMRMCSLSALMSQFPKEVLEPRSSSGSLNGRKECHLESRMVLIQNVSAFAGCSLCHGVLAGIADFGKMRLHASFNSSATGLCICTNFLDVGAASFRNCRSFHQNGLTGRGDVAKMRLDACLDASIAWLNAGA
jgi:hypothetical protein